jgi:hypothetical protein
MRNGVSFSKHYRRRGRVSSGWTAAALIALSLVARASADAPGPLALARIEVPRLGAAFTPPGRPSPGLARLFTPRQPEGAFEVRLLDAGIEAARQAVLELVPNRSAVAPSKEPSVLEMDPLRAFGATGDYPRTTVARLYTGRQAKVVRIPVVAGGRTIAAVTLVSPYPDATLSRLVEGTMVIVLYLDRR